MAERLGLGPGSVVVDLAAGTCKLTRVLMGTGARVVAVEPVAAMRAELAGSVPGVELVAGLAEAIPLAAASAEAVTVAQAFHWFRGEAALAEIHRVLRAGGGLAIVFNRRDFDQPIHAALERTFTRYRAGAPRHDDDKWRSALDSTGLFEPLDHAEVEHHQQVDTEGLVDRVLSISFMALLDDAQRSLAEAEVRAIAANLPQPISLRYHTEARLFRRR
jgi:SAM-dependent methyltransferase